jgi:hypothetical protein
VLRGLAGGGGLAGVLLRLAQLSHRNGQLCDRGDQLQRGQGWIASEPGGPG